MGKVLSFLGWCTFVVAVLDLVTFFLPATPVAVSVNACGIPFWPLGILLGPALVRKGRAISGRKSFV